MGYFDRVVEVLEAGAPVVMVRTTEFERAYAGLKRWCKEADCVLYRWNCVEGMLEMSVSFDTVMVVDERVSDLIQVLTEVERRQDSAEPELFVLEGVHDFIERADVKVLLRKLTADLPKSGSKKRVVLLNPIPELPPELCAAIPVVEMPLPDEQELSRLLDNIAREKKTSVDSEARAVLLEAASGMTLDAAKLAFRIAAARSGFTAAAAAVVRECKQLYLPSEFAS